MKQLLLIGGGHSHALALRAWARQPLPGVQLRLLSPHRFSLYSGRVPAWLAGRVPPQALQIDLQALCRAAGAELRLGELAELDAPAQRARCDDGSQLRYDWASVNTGSTLQAPAHDGPVLALRPLAGLLAQWPALLTAFERGSGPLSIDMVGGGAAGVEVLLAVLHRLRALRPDRAVQARLFASGARLLPGHNAGVARRAEAALRQAGVGLCLNRRWQAGDSPAGAWLLWAAGAQPPAWLAQSRLALSGDGFLPVAATLQSLQHETLFAVGDSAAFQPPLDKSGVRAVRMAPTLAHNLRAAITGQPLQAHRPQREVLALLALPDGRAIASRGGWLAADGRWVGRWKDRLDQDFMQLFSPEALASLQPALS
jgi:pyridine nucleotide-disulfide oxidoreductase family protein